MCGVLNRPDFVGWSEVSQECTSWTRSRPKVSASEVLLWSFMQSVYPVQTEVKHQSGDEWWEVLLVQIWHWRGCVGDLGTVSGASEAQGSNFEPSLHSEPVEAAAATDKGHMQPCVCVCVAKLRSTSASVSVVYTVTMAGAAKTTVSKNSSQTGASANLHFRVCV